MQYALVTYASTCSVLLPYALTYYQNSLLYLLDWLFAILGPNPTLQNNMTGRERPQSHHSSNQSTSATGRDDGKMGQPTTSRFGSNIHTLKHDEDDGRFNDRNSFWNGNSTQYGGGNDDK